MTSRCFLTSVVAFGVLLASPGVAGAQAPAGDSVLGSGATATGNSFTIDVSGGPSGEHPTGGASALVADMPFHSTSVDCFAVNGNLATFAGGLSPNRFSYTYYKVTVVDNGRTGDVVRVHVATTPFDCTEPLDPLFDNPLATGDMVVVDAAALPTSKQQCKNGGWRTFPGFKNQGDCVSSVASGDKRPPAGA